MKNADPGAVYRKNERSVEQRAQHSGMDEDHVSHDVCIFKQPRRQNI